jgi:hypothetical protein
VPTTSWPAARAASTTGTARSDPRARPRRHRSLRLGAVERLLPGRPGRRSSRAQGEPIRRRDRRAAPEHPIYEGLAHFIRGRLVSEQRDADLVPWYSSTEPDERLTLRRSIARAFDRRSSEFEVVKLVVKDGKVKAKFETPDGAGLPRTRRRRRFPSLEGLRRVAGADSPPRSTPTQKDPSDRGADKPSRHERQPEEQQRERLRVGGRDAGPDQDAEAATESGCESSRRAIALAKRVERDDNGAFAQW